MPNPNVTAHSLGGGYFSVELTSNDQVIVQVMTGDPDEEASEAPEELTFTTPVMVYFIPDTNQLFQVRRGSKIFHERNPPSTSPATWIGLPVPKGVQSEDAWQCVLTTNGEEAVICVVPLKPPS